MTILFEWKKIWWFGMWEKVRQKKTKEGRMAWASAMSEA